MADHTDVLQGLVLEAGAYVADDSCNPRHQPRHQRDHPRCDTGESRREQHAQRKQHQTFGGNEHEQLDRMRGKIPGGPIDGAQLERTCSGRIDGDQRGEAEPLADDDLAAANGSGKHGQEQPALHLARDEWARHHGRAQCEHAAEHESDDDQQLGRDQRDLVRRQRCAVAARHGRDLVEAPGGEADDDQGQDQQGEQEPASR